MENNEIIAWSVALAAIAFVILCGFIISLLKTAQRSLVTAQSAMQEVKETVEGLQGEVKKLAESVNDTAENIKSKLQSTDPLFHAVQDVGVLISEVTGTARRATENLANTLREQTASKDGNNPSPSWLQWAALASRLIMSAQKGWKQQKDRSYAKEEI
ncbi:DUF948 domain-containing protein [Cohnella mopanensis]|uniref:DUF948 domain-containing protein n=1 Tax=Cohnella mopanensis TaxID=2911966 RepID=UPI001EF8F26A|nr:DUF948 domain-containing protein [Cohnella mopanensis]